MGCSYFTFDDDVTLDAAANDPIGFVDDLPDRSILDEVQRVPDLFTAPERAVDRNRRPGRFLLTGSANVLLLPKLADSLAGRMEILRPHPFVHCEITEQSPAFLDALFEGRLTSRLLTLAAGRTARLLNVSDLAAPFQLSLPTIKDYVTLLKRVFLLEQLPPWHNNRLSRLIKTPKLHLGDTGVACALLGLDAEALSADRTTLGQLLETFVYQELRRQARRRNEDIRFHHFRDKDGVEVDVVLERGGQATAGVEVKASATVTAADFRGLRKLRETVGKRFAGGVVLYDGETSVGFGEGLYAVPIRAVWDL